MFYVKHYDENSQLFQQIGIEDGKSLAMYKENQMSKGEFALIYDSCTDELIEDYEKN